MALDQAVAQTVLDLHITDQVSLVFQLMHNICSRMRKNCDVDGYIIVDVLVCGCRCV